MMWSVYRHDDSSRAAEPDENAMPGLAPAVPPGLDPVELVVDGERFVVTRRADSPGTYDFDWISHPASYGFTIGTNFEWRPDRAELTEQIRDFLARDRPRDRLPARLIRRRIGLLEDVSLAFRMRDRFTLLTCNS